MSDDFETGLVERTLQRIYELLDADPWERDGAWRAHPNAHILRDELEEMSDTILHTGRVTMQQFDDMQTIEQGGYAK